MVIWYNSPRKLIYRTSNLFQGTEDESDPKLKQGKTLGVMIKGKRKEKKWVIPLSEGVVKEGFCRVMNEDVQAFAKQMTRGTGRWKVRRGNLFWELKMPAPSCPGRFPLISHLYLYSQVHATWQVQSDQHRKRTTISSVVKLHFS